jgi:HipA-like protein
MRTNVNSAAIAGEKLEVRHADRLVGHIERKSPSVLDIGFSYHDAWMAAADSFPVSVRMPLSRKEHEPAIVYPWFLNLLPEGPTLEMVGAILHVHEADVFAILQEMGGDLAGALDIREDGEASPARKPRYRRLTDAELGDAIKRLPERPLLVGEDGIHMSVAGAQEKLPVARYDDGGIGLALDGAPSTHILKPRNAKFRAAIENEAFRPGPGLKACMDVLNVTRAVAPNKIRFMDYMLFNVLCGNVDAHAKNYSLLIQSGGNVTMAPLYDVMNGDIYDGVTRSMAMKIGKKLGGHIYGRHWDRFAEENDLSKTQVRRRVAELSTAVLKAVPKVVEEMNKSNIPSAAYKEIGGYVAGYCRHMLANLKTDVKEEDEPDDEPSAVPAP